MVSTKLEQLKYPIGHFACPEEITQNHLKEWIHDLETLPQRFETLVTSLNEEQLETPYRPGGWSVRQVIHHVSDSHHHSYIRFKWALTEDNPLIKPYDEKAWAQLFDTQTAPIAMSLTHLKAVHTKLVYLLKGLSPSDLERTFRHPEGDTTTTLKENVGRYAWHGNHHYAHIANMVEREGW